MERKIELLINIEKMLYKIFIKRLLDIFLSCAGIIIISPFILIIIFLVRYKLGSPVFFKQTRPGLNGKLFTIIKFRTMTNAIDQNGKLLPDEKRMTDFGQWLRGTSLDELPELYNVIKGDMSLVGPRPLLERYLARYTREQARRNDVKPGLTGWAQVNGRNAINWENKFKLDVWYVDNLSFSTDLRILLLTIVKVISKDGISAVGEISSPEFYGSKISEDQTK